MDKLGASESMSRGKGSVCGKIIMFGGHSQRASLSLTKPALNEMLDSMDSEAGSDGGGLSVQGTDSGMVACFARM
jgi:hypothetical protein